MRNKNCIKIIIYINDKKKIAKRIKQLKSRLKKDI